MCLEDRNTVKRGRSAEPLIFLRIDALRRSLELSLVLAMLRSSRLADLTLDHFFEIFDAFALVGLGRTNRADFRGGLAEQLAIDAGEDDHVLLDLGADALGQIERHWMRKAERHVELLARHFGLVTDAVDFQATLEAFGDALDHVRQVGAQRAMVGAHGAIIRRALTLHVLAGDLDRNPRRHFSLELTL